jgi:tetratricopeptide (TPR) repeat protein
VSVYGYFVPPQGHEGQTGITLKARKQGRDPTKRRSRSSAPESFAGQPTPKPYYHLAQLYRVAFKPEQALGLLLETVRLDPNFADAHASLAEIYVLRDDYSSAWRHSRLAAANGIPRVVEMLTRNGVTPT